MENLSNIAQHAAGEAGKILLKNYGKVAKEEIRQKSATDFISFVDEQSEKKIVEIIRGTYPKHSILAEEGGADETESPYRWIIDPLDEIGRASCRERV